MKQLTGGSEADRAAAIERYLTLLKSGGSDHPMTLLQRAGVDLSKPETVRAVVDQLDRLVTQLEQAIAQARLSDARLERYLLTDSPALPGLTECFSRASSCGTRSRLCVAPMQASITTINPPFVARAAASSFVIPLCSHSALAPIVDRFVGDAGVSSARRKTSTMSMRSGTSTSDGYDRSPRTSVSRGLTGITR